MCFVELFSRGPMIILAERLTYNSGRHFRKWCRSFASILVENQCALERIKKPIQGVEGLKIWTTRSADTTMNIKGIDIVISKEEMMEALEASVDKNIINVEELKSNKRDSLAVTVNVTEDSSEELIKNSCLTI